MFGALFIAGHEISQINVYENGESKVRRERERETESCSRGYVKCLAEFIF